MMRRSGPKKASARDSACMRWPSRQITASDIAGASALAATARARSASTRPSAPSATCASVRTLPGWRDCAGERTIMGSLERRTGAVEITEATEHRRVDHRRHGLRSVHPGEKLLVGNVEPGLQHVEFVLAQVLESGIGKPAQHEIHLADAAMSAAEKQPTPACVQTFTRQIAQRRSPTPKTRTRPGRGYIGAAAGDVTA